MAGKQKKGESNSAYKARVSAANAKSYQAQGIWSRVRAATRRGRGRNGSRNGGGALPYEDAEQLTPDGGRSLRDVTTGDPTWDEGAALCTVGSSSTRAYM